MIAVRAQLDLALGAEEVVVLGAARGSR